MTYGMQNCTRLSTVTRIHCVPLSANVPVSAIAAPRISPDPTQFMLVTTSGSTRRSPRSVTVSAPYAKPLVSAINSAGVSADACPKNITATPAIASSSTSPSRVFARSPSSSGDRSNTQIGEVY